MNLTRERATCSQLFANSFKPCQLSGSSIIYCKVLLVAAGSPAALCFPASKRTVRKLHCLYLSCQSVKATKYAGEGLFAPCTASARLAPRYRFSLQVFSSGKIRYVTIRLISKLGVPYMF